MMLKKWIQPALKKRIVEVIEICESDDKSLSFQYNEKLKRAKSTVDQETYSLLLEIEDLINQKDYVIEKAYKIGFEDGFNLMREAK